MTHIKDQPPPVGVSHPESWPRAMVEYAQWFRENSAVGMGPEIQTAAATLGAMGERHKLGVERYGVGLQPGNGRDPIVDAAQEALDLCAYLTQSLQEAEMGLGFDRLKLPPGLSEGAVEALRGARASVARARLARAFELATELVGELSGRG